MSKRTFFILFQLLSLLILSHTSWGQIKLIVNTEKDTTIEVMKDSIQMNQYITNKIAQLQNMGYINASIDSISKEAAYIIYIHRGKQYKLKSFNIDYSNRPENNFNRKKKLPTYANLQWIQKQKTTIVKELENTGYPFARIETNFQADSADLLIKLTVITGHLYKFDTIATNKIKLKKHFIQRYLGIKPGELYSEQKVSEINERLSQLKYIKLEETPSITFGKNTVRPELILKHTPANRFNGLIGIVPDKSKPGNYTITGDIELSLLNTLSRGESIDMQWKKNEKNSQQLNIKTEWPFILNTPFGAKGQISMLKQDTSFLSVDMKIGSFILFNGNNSASGYYSDKRTIVLAPLDTTETIASKSYGTGIALATFKTNNILNPLKGYRVELEIEAGSRTSNNSDKSMRKGWYWESTTTLQGFIPIYKQWGMVLQNRSSIKRSQNPYYKNELFRIGGMKTLRGFDENEFYANQYTINTLEIRWLFETNSHVKLFADHSFIETKHAKDHSKSKALGIGVGMNLHTNAGIFTISYALGKRDNEILKLNNAKIHFGYINSF